MNRREFIAYLGIGTSALLVDPASLLTATPVVDPAYPELFFTGFKLSQTNALAAGQFLWRADWTGVDGQPGTTHWYVNVVLTLLAVRDIGRPAIVAQIQNGTLSVAKFMDEIVFEARQGRVQTGHFEQIPNQSYNPDLPATTPYDDEYDVWNPLMVNGPPIYKEIRQLKLFSFDENYPCNGWDFERQADIACTMFSA